MSDRFDRPSCNLTDPDRLRHTPVECRCGKGVCHEGQHECACGGRWGSQPSVPTPDSPKISPEDAQPRESASERGRVRIFDGNWNCLVDEHAQDGDTPSDVIQRATDALAGDQ